MADQGFDTLVSSGLLREVEEIVVNAYRGAHPAASRTVAYRWLRYEDPDPVAQLAEGFTKLRKSGASFDGEAVDKACAKARERGLLN